MSVANSVANSRLGLTYFFNSRLFSSPFIQSFIHSAKVPFPDSFVTRYHWFSRLLDWIIRPSENRHGLMIVLEPEIGCETKWMPWCLPDINKIYKVFFGGVRTDKTQGVCAPTGQTG